MGFPAWRGVEWPIRSLKGRGLCCNPRIMKAAVLSLLGLTAACAAWAGMTPHHALLVLSKGDHMLAIVDVSTGKVIAKAPVGEDPHEVISSSDGKLHMCPTTVEEPTTR